MLNYNEATKGALIVLEGEVYEVLSAHIFRMQMRKPVNNVELRQVRTGAKKSYTFHQNDTIEEAEVEKRTIRFIYERNGEYWFMDPADPRNRFAVASDIVGDGGVYLKANMDADALYFNDELIKVKLPVKVELAVTEAPPNIKGNTAQGGSKPVTLETGAVVNTPLFVVIGDVIRVNTESHEYVERVSKA
jgi:elongation factor P